MTRDRTYLDWNATAPLRPEARAATLDALDLAGNPSSVHAEGRAARGLVERARGQVAAALGCKPTEVIFTSGATEAASVLSRFGGVAVAGTAHDCLWAHRRDAPQIGVYAMGLANSETGVLTEPPARGADGWPCAGGRAQLLMLDVVQAVGRVPFSFAWSGADMAIVSAHKLGGPKGVGALILRDGLDIPALSLGGGQELGRRSGTENVAGIAGFGAAAEAAQRDMEAGVWVRVEKLRKILEDALASGGKEIIFVGKDDPRLPNTSCFAVPGWKGETQVMQMDLAGFAISAGSACSSGKVKTSRVLLEMGFDATTAASAIRVSLGPGTSEEDVARFAEAWLARLAKHRARAA
ncbi:aminotransferase [Maritimibacter sp. 55A14]|uniref:cysteine desulfurase family protein n=1 Tax=Maritimibacter sp. 55A14 TaxID=2174844 RepID=UPI000D6118FF|nr:aminotransferase class V-fold PLP-dependent enzyme [Maritimibacter sp. 55A14]PWE33107.1 aminotransferase [Maritimibacter sp. 55A14]